jgi:gliding motility-associated-like protein
LPAGVTGNLAAGTVTISGIPTAAGSFNYTVNLTGGCGGGTAGGTILVNPNNTIILTSAAGTNNQTLCINTAITNITYSTTGATGATFAGLPTGVTGNWAGGTVTISGTPTASGNFNYTVTLTGGCGAISAAGTITVNPVNTIVLTSAPGTDNQTSCINTAIANITYLTTGATGATFTGLPTGVTGNLAAGIVTISGIPTVSGSYSYTVNLTGGCGVISANGTINVTPDNTIALTSAFGTNNQALCINTGITNITYATTGATGATFAGLPTGVTGSWAAGIVTINGIPSVAGIFNYTITLTGGCGTVSAGGMITVNPDNTISLSSAAGTNNQTLCINTAITNITYSTTGATGATFAGLPTGVTGNWAGGTVTISGIPTVSGNYNYTVTLTGGCGIITAGGTIIVNPDNTIALSSAAGSDNQTTCINTVITNITYLTTGASGATFTGLPAGVTGNFASGTVTISGIPTASGTFNYTVNLTGGCGVISKTGTIIVTPDNTMSLTSAVGTDNQTLCINTIITNITYATTGATGATFAGLPTGVTGTWAGGIVTISGTPSVSGTFNYVVTLTGGCGTITAPGIINVTPDNTIIITSAVGTDNQILCHNTPIIPITYSTTGATGATFAGLPTGVIGNWVAGNITITGTPTIPGTYNYSISLTGGCFSLPETGTITVNGDNTISLTSAPGTDNQTVCVNNVITTITYVTTGATGAIFTGLPAGMTVSFAANTIIISGIPTATGTFNYNVDLTGGCGVISGGGIITVVPDKSITLLSAPGADNQTICLTDTIVTIDYISTGATGATFTGLPGGVTGIFVNDTIRISGTPTLTGTFNYLVTLTGMCGVATAPGTIIVNPRPVLVVNNPAAACSPATIDITDPSVTFGSTPGLTLTYWTDAAATIPYLSAGTSTTGIYYIKGTNPSGCYEIKPVTVVINVSPAASVVVTNVSCFAGATGGVDLTVTGGTLPYTFIWSNGATTEDLVNVVAGNYSVIVTDASLCTANVSGNVTQPAAALTITTSQTDVLCSSGTTGIATAIPAGGTGPYTYSWNTIPAQNTATATALGAGTYTVTVTDANLCTATATVTITEPAAALTVTTSQVDVACFGGTTGSATAIPAGGTAPYAYSWNTLPVQTTASISTLGVGIYTVTVTDANLCTAIATVTITGPAAPLTLTTTQVDVACLGGTNGSATAVPAGGTSPYTYSWNTVPVQTNATATGLVAGSYTVTVTDANLCTASASVTITEPATALTGSITSQTNVSTFGGNDGSVTITASGGSGSYQYRLGAGTYQASGTFGTLVAGSYNVTIQDASMCTVIVPVTITQPINPLGGSITAQTDVVCFGASTGSVTVVGTGGVAPLEYKIGAGAYQAPGTFSSLAAGSYTVTVRDALLATFDVPVTIIQPAAPLTIATTRVNISCFGGTNGSATAIPAGGTGPYTFSWNTVPVQTTASISSQPAGSYTVTVQDSKLCSAIATVTITQPLALNGNMAVTNVLCSGANTGALNLTVTGGTGPFGFLWSNSATTEDISGLTAGSYSVKITDANSCTANVPAQVTEPAPLAIEEDVQKTSCIDEKDGSITVTVTGGIAPYAYSWNTTPVQTTETATALDTGFYIITITDVNLCTATKTIEVSFNQNESCLSIPKVITPNGDGKNDTWIIKNIDMYPDAEVLLYNRWGELIWRTKNISANPWDGKYRGKPVPVDSYHYILYLNDGSEPKSGVLSVIR